jgi:beta-galactosidase
MLREGFADRVKEHVLSGGTFVMTYVSGFVDEEDLCFLGGFPGPLKDVAGLWDEEVDALFPGIRNSFSWQGKTYEAVDFCELTHPITATALAVYDKDFYMGMPALLANNYGKGKCYYIAARTGEDFLCDFYRYAALEKGIKPMLSYLPRGIGAARRVGKNGQEFLFITNFLNESNEVALEGDWVDLLLEKETGGQLTVSPRSVTVLKRG